MESSRDGSLEGSRKQPLTAQNPSSEKGGDMDQRRHSRRICQPLWDILVIKWRPVVFPAKSAPQWLPNWFWALLFLSELLGQSIILKVTLVVKQLDTL